MTQHKIEYRSAVASISRLRSSKVADLYASPCVKCVRSPGTFVFIARCFALSLLQSPVKLDGISLTACLCWSLLNNGNSLAEGYPK